MDLTTPVSSLPLVGPAFARRLEKELSIAVILQNEEFTTVFMVSFLKSLGLNDKQIKAKIDKYAAQKILESYLSITK